MIQFMEKHKHIGMLLLRYFFGVAFLVAAIDKILGFSMAKEMFGMMFGGAGTPLLYFAIVIELVGGLALLFNFHAACAALVLAGMIAVAFFATFKLGAVPNVVAMLREVLVMNTGGGNTAVNAAYFFGLLALAFSGCDSCKVKKK